MKKGIIAVLSGIVGFIAGSAVKETVLSEEVPEQDDKMNRVRSYYHLLLDWLSLKQDGDSLISYFLEKSYQTIAIYGMGELGILLLKELEGSDVKVICAIDQSDACGYADVEVKKVGEPVKNVDAVIVTPIFAYDEISETLSGYIDCPVISLENVIYRN